jgi:hypothetical protein
MVVEPITLPGVAGGQASGQASDSLPHIREESAGDLRSWRQQTPGALRANIDNRPVVAK